MLKILKKIHFLACNFWNIDFFKIIQKTIKSTHPWLQNDIKKSWGRRSQFYAKRPSLSALFQNWLKLCHALFKTFLAQNWERRPQLFLSFCSQGCVDLIVFWIILKKSLFQKLHAKKWIFFRNFNILKLLSQDLNFFKFWNQPFTHILTPK